MFNVPGVTYALKTGTSDVKTSKGNRPRDGWMAAYMPGKVALFRAGNADASPMNINAYGEIMTNPLKTFIGYLSKNNYLNKDDMPNQDTSTLQISKISGKIASPSTPPEFVVSTLRYNGAPSPAVDDGAIPISVDATCNGQLSPYTTPENTKHGYLITPTSFMPGGMDLGEITQWWKQSTQLT